MRSYLLLFLLITACGGGAGGYSVEQPVLEDSGQDAGSPNLDAGSDAPAEANPWELEKCWDDLRTSGAVLSCADGGLSVQFHLFYQEPGLGLVPGPDKFLASCPHGCDPVYAGDPFCFRCGQ